MSLIAEALYRLNERAGICEYDGGMSREDSEQVAIDELERDDSLPPGVRRQAVRMWRERNEQDRREQAVSAAPGAATLRAAPGAARARVGRARQA